MGSHSVAVNPHSVAVNPHSVAVNPHSVAVTKKKGIYSPYRPPNFLCFRGLIDIRPLLICYWNFSKSVLFANKRLYFLGCYNQAQDL
jgi:hypothetical protein